MSRCDGVTFDRSKNRIPYNVGTARTSLLRSAICGGTLTILPYAPWKCEISKGWTCGRCLLVSEKIAGKQADLLAEGLAEGRVSLLCSSPSSASSPAPACHEPIAAAGALGSPRLRHALRANATRPACSSSAPLSSPPPPPPVSQAPDPPPSSHCIRRASCSRRPSIRTSRPVPLGITAASSWRLFAQPPDC